MTAPILRMKKRVPLTVPDTRRHLINIFKTRFETEIPKPWPWTWGKAQQAMLTFRVVDELTGEETVEFPSEAAWQDQVDGFFNDEWARDRMGYDFAYFLKRFGQFAKYKKAPKPKSEFVSPWDTCADCGKDFLKTEGHKCAT